MGCDFKNSAQKETLNLTWASDAKGYNPVELDRLIAYIDQTTTWLTELQMSDTEDLLVYRVGVPLVVSTGMSDAEQLVGLDIEEDTYVLKSIGLDCVKITSKYYKDGEEVKQRTAGYNTTYTYKAEYRHAILDNYYIDGVGNSTGWTYSVTIGVDPVTKEPIVNSTEYPEITYINNPQYNLNLAANVGVPVQYSGVPTLAITAELPDYVKNCILMILQNIGLAKDFTEANTEDKKGDLVYTTIGRFKYKLGVIKDNAINKKKTFFGEYYEDIQYILEAIDLDQAFKDVQYGGLIDNLNLQIRIPASYANELMLKGFIEDNEVALYLNKPLIDINETDRQVYFNHVFKEEMISEEAFNDANISEHSKKDMLLDIDRVRDAITRIVNNDDSEINDDIWEINQWFNTSYNRYKAEDILAIKSLQLPEYNGIKGCKYQYDETSSDGDGGTITTTITQYRHWYVNAEWLDGLDYSRLAVIFWTGIDLQVDSENNPCPYDTVIVIIILVVLMCMGLPPEGAEYLWYHYMLIASTVISIGLQLGVFGTGKTAKHMQILAAVLALASGYGSWQDAVTKSTATTAQTIGFSMKVAGTVLSTYGTLEQMKFEDDMTDMKKELDSLVEAGEMYQSQLRFMYEDSYRLPQLVMEQDPYDAIREIYKPYTVYNTKGFMET